MQPLIRNGNHHTLRSPVHRRNHGDILVLARLHAQQATPELGTVEGEDSCWTRN